MPQIIVLYGTSSAGKTTLAKALQVVLPEPYLHVCIDAFEEVMPGRGEEGGVFEESAVFARLLSGMHGAIVALAEAGNNLIVDHILLEGVDPPDWISSFVESIARYPSYFIKVTCPLPELIQRENLRGDRKVGLAEWQYSRLPTSLTPDLEVDSSVENATEAARRIASLLVPPPSIQSKVTSRAVHSCASTLSFTHGFKGMDRRKEAPSIVCGIRKRASAIFDVY